VLLSHNGLVENSYFDCTNGQCGIRFESYRMIARNNFFYGNPSPSTSDSALISVACNADISVQATDVSIMGNVFYQNFYGINTTGKRVNIIGNLFYGQYNPSGARAIAVSLYSGAVIFGSEETLISGNLIHDVRYGVTLASGTSSNGYVKRISIIGNQIINTGAGINGYYAIHESGSYTDENFIVGNTIRGTWTGGVNVVGANTYAANNVTASGMTVPHSAAMKLGFFGATPIIQPTTGVAGATFVENSGTPINTASTFDGYTIAQVVKALRNLGLLA